MIAVLAGGTRKVLLEIPGESLRYPIYSPTGHLLYQRETTNPGIWAVPFSLQRLETTGAPMLVVPRGRTPSLASDGTLAFVRPDEAPVDLVRVSRSGTVEKIAELAETNTSMVSPVQSGGGYRPTAGVSLSPDGTRLAVSFGLAPGQLWVYDLQRGSVSRVTIGHLSIPSRLDQPRQPSDLRIVARSARVEPLVSSRRRRWRREAAVAQRRSPPSAGGVARRVNPGVRRRIGVDRKPSSNAARRARRRRARCSRAGPGDSAPAFRPTAGGWRTSPSNRAAWKSTCGRSPMVISASRCRAAVVRCRCGRKPARFSTSRRTACHRSPSRRRAARSPSPSRLCCFRRAARLTWCRSSMPTPDGQHFLMLRSRGSQHLALIFNWPSDLARLGAPNASSDR